MNFNKIGTSLLDFFLFHISRYDIVKYNTFHVFLAQKNSSVGTEINKSVFFEAIIFARFISIRKIRHYSIERHCKKKSLTTSYTISSADGLFHKR